MNKVEFNLLFSSIFFLDNKSTNLLLFGGDFIQDVVSFLQANPMKLVSRIKKIQDDISTLKEQCREVLIAKQVLSSFIISRKVLARRNKFELLDHALCI